MAGEARIAIRTVIPGGIEDLPSWCYHGKDPITCNPNGFRCRGELFSDLDFAVFSTNPVDWIVGGSLSFEDFVQCVVKTGLLALFLAPIFQGVLQVVLETFNVCTKRLDVHFHINRIS